MTLNREDSEIIVGTAYSDEAGDEISITVIATGFDGEIPKFSPSDITETKSEIEEVVEEEEKVENFELPPWLVRTNKK